MSYPEVFISQTKWIAREKNSRSIKFMLGLGDITHRNTHPMWMNAVRAISVLDEAEIPYLLANGNHDIGKWGYAADRSSFFSDYFVQNSSDPGRKSRNIGESENAYRSVTVGKAKFLLLALEFGTRDAVIDWANEIMAKFPDHHAIMITHSYLYSDGTRYDYKAKGASQRFGNFQYGVCSSKDGCNDGEQIWTKLISRHPQFVFTFNGHVITGNGIAHLKSNGERGNEVHQMLVNYQCSVKPERPKGGGGFLRLVEVQPDGRTIKIRDYSPYLDQWLDEAERRFTIILDRNLNERFSRY